MTPQYLKEMQPENMPLFNNAIPLLTFPQEQFFPLKDPLLFSGINTYREELIGPLSTDKKPDLSDIFRIYGEQYRQKHKLSDHQIRVISDIEKCRTFELGYHIDRCTNCGYEEVLANSCGNRHCPKCQRGKQEKWIETRIEELLPVKYYHLVFTLPDKIFPLNIYNQKVIYDLLVKSASETLKDFGRDKKWLGGEIGFYGILHTWGQTLVSHPHVHFVVTSGGLDERGNWIFPKYKDKFLFPVKGLSRVFRGKFIEGLKSEYKDIVFPEDSAGVSKEEKFKNWLKDLCSRDWIVYSKSPFGGPLEIINYLGRYTHRTAISNSRILSLDNGKVRFRYKNYKRLKDDGHYSWEELEIEAEDFIRRYVYHILPAGYHRIRYYGILSNGNVKRQEALESLRNEEFQDIEKDLTVKEDIVCPACQKGKMKLSVLVNRRGKVIRARELLKEIERFNST